MLTLAIYVAWMSLCVAACTYVLVLCAKWLDHPKKSAGRAILAVIAIYAANASINALGHMWQPHPALADDVGVFVLHILCSILIIQLFFQATWKRAFVSCIGMALVQAVFVALAFLLLRPYVVEKYEIPTDSMAPTLTTVHRTIPCPTCGGPMVMEVEHRPGYPEPAVESAFCPHCMKTIQVPAAQKVAPLTSADRVAVNKIVKPQRWDVLAYHQDRQIWVKRVVGLPGETIMIDDDGKISVNGSPIGPPGLPTLRFPWPDTGGMPWAIHPGEPIHLADDEYFVIGDWAEHSLDSRMFGPVKKKDTVGVVALIYWPPSRFRILR